MKPSSRTGGWIKLVNDDRLVGYLKDRGYDYDFEDRKWYDPKDPGTSIFEIERGLGGTTPERISGFRAALEKSPSGGSIRAELEGVREAVDGRIDKLTSLPHLDREIEDLDRVSRSIFSPTTKGDRRPDAIDWAKELVSKHIETEFTELKDDAIEHKDRFSGVTRRDALDEARTLLDERSRDTKTVEKLIKPTITWADKRVDALSFKRELARDYTKDEIDDLGINSVQVFAQEHGFDREDPKDLDEVRSILRSKGARLTGKRDRFGNELFDLKGKSGSESDDGFSITPI